MTVKSRIGEYTRKAPFETVLITQITNRRVVAYVAYRKSVWRKYRSDIPFYKGRENVKGQKRIVTPFSIINIDVIPALRRLIV